MNTGNNKTFDLYPNLPDEGDPPRKNQTYLIEIKACFSNMADLKEKLQRMAEMIETKLPESESMFHYIIMAKSGQSMITRINKTKEKI